MHDEGVSTKKEPKDKVSLKTVLISCTFAFIMCMIVLIGTTLYTNKKTAPVVSEEVKYTEGDVLPSGAVAHDEKGGTAQLTLTDGTVLEYKIPKDMYDVHEDYLSLVQVSYGLSSPVTSDNLIVLGDTNNVYTSKSAITATTQTDTLAIFKQIFAGEETEIALEDTYSPVYLYMTSGEIPTTPYTNYTVTEQDSLVKDGITYRVFVQEYDVDSVADPDTNQTVTERVKQLVAYSDTDDVVEIIVDAETNDMEAATKMLKIFLDI